MTNDLPQPDRPLAIACKVQLIIAPILLAWAVWVTVNVLDGIAFRSVGNRFTATDADLLERRMIERIERKHHEPEGPTNGVR